MPTQVLNPPTESKRAVKQLLRYLKGMPVRKRMIEPNGRSDSDWAGDSSTRQSVTSNNCNLQGVMLSNRSLNQTAISPSSCEAEHYAAGACAVELLGLAELFKELYHKVSVHLEMDPDCARQVLERGGPEAH